MKLTNELNLPGPIVRAVESFDEAYMESKGGRHSDWTASQLPQPPLKVALQSRHDDELSEDVADRIYSLFGNVVHGILERAAGRGADETTLVDRDFVLVESRLYANVDGFTISGQLDHALLQREPAGWHLDDWKVVSVWESINAPKPEKVAQANILAQLLRLNGYAPVTSLSLVYLFRDWSKRKAARGEHPPHQVKVQPVECWSQEQAFLYIQERVRLHAKARNLQDQYITICSESERWQAPPVYAVTKQGRKSAVKLFGDFEEACRFIGQDRTLSVVERPSEPVRCLSYCSAAPVCPFAKAYRAQKENSDGN